MKKTDYTFNGSTVGYEVADDGYDIYLGDKKWITQHEPYIPYPSLGYEGSCLKQIEDLCAPRPDGIPEQTMEERLSALEEENAMLSATLDDILTNVIPMMTGESEVN